MIVIFKIVVKIINIFIHNGRFRKKNMQKSFLFFIHNLSATYDSGLEKKIPGNTHLIVELCFILIQRYKIKTLFVKKATISWQCGAYKTGVMVLIVYCYIFFFHMISYLNLLCRLQPDMD